METSLGERKRHMLASTRIPLCDYPARRIALIKPSALGDIVHSLPVLTAVRRRYPEAHITWVVNRGYEPLLIGHPDLNATLPFDRSASRGGWWPALRNYGGFIRGLRRQRFDLVLDLQGLLRTGLMTAASGARRRVGLSTAREGATWFYSDVVPVANFHAVHAVDRYWLLAEALGVGDGPKCFRVPIPDHAKAWAAEILHGCPRPWLAVGAGSRWITKRWLPDHFAVVARLAQQHFEGTVIFVGGHDEAPISQAVAIQLLGPWRDLTGKTSLPQLAAVLAQADAMLANDTGPLHLAAALGRPVVAPYTCTRVVLNGPYGAESNAVETRVWCKGSYLKRCPRLECMNDLTPDRLWPILQEILQAWVSKRRSA
jgi:lipopolysaccharide heptosyltransferase I